MSTYSTNTNKQMPAEKPYPMGKKTPPKKLPASDEFKSTDKPAGSASTGVIKHLAGCGGNHLGSC